MKRFLTGVIVLAVSLLPVYSLSAEELEPEEPDMILPPMSLELEDILKENLDTVLPEQQFVPELDLDTGLPDPPEIEIPASLVDLDIEFELEGSQPGIIKEKSGSFYSNGKIGLGNTNRILGDISIYKLGAEPHFQMQFTHERYDGYHFRETGSGFFHQLNLLSAGISFRPNKFDLDINAFLKETGDGLQGLGTYNSVLHRFFGGDISFTYSFTENVSIGAGLDALWSLETLSGSVPVNGYELALTPGISALFIAEPVTVSLEGKYDFRYVADADSILHGVSGRLGIDVSLPKWWDFGGIVGVDWHNRKIIQVPFALYIRKGIADVLDISLGGGFDTSIRRYGDLWLELPFYRLNSETAYPDVYKWFASAGIEWEIVPYLTFEATADFSRFEASIYPDTGMDPGTGMLTFYSTPAYLLESGAGIRWETLEWLSLRTYWDGAFLDVPYILPSHIAGLSLELSTSNQIWRGGFTLELPVYDRPEMPFLGCSITFAPVGGVEFTLSGNDLLAPAMNENRKEWEYYETTGLNILFVARISL